MEKKKEKFTLTPILLVILSFLVIILTGSLLMATPLANTNGEWRNYIDALLVSTSGTCVTGLCSLPNGVGKDFTLFGQIVLLICIQIGGLGFITIFSFIATLIKRKLEFKDWVFLTIAVGSNSISALAKFVRKVILISFSFELLGFLLSLPVFLTLYPNDTGLAIWNSVFHSISSFNNAGFDLLGPTSFILGAGSVLDTLSSELYVYLNIITMFLVIAGGLSFLTYIDIFSFKKWKQYKSFTKMALIGTTCLIFGGFLIFSLIECTKGENAMDPLQALFHSVSLRTAGFATYDQSELTNASKIVSCVLMFIGGSPVSTAGGIKTTTVFLIILAIINYIRGRNVYAFNRHYPEKTIVKAMTVLFLGILVILIGFIFIAIFERNAINPLINTENILYEVFSAFGTVGVTTGITTSLSIGSKIVICLMMFLGRLGPITLFQIFQKNMNVENNKHYKMIDEDIAIG